MVDETRTLTDADTRAVRPALPKVPVLFVAYGPDLESIGQRLVVPTDQPLVLGRACPEFGAHAFEDPLASRRHVEMRRLSGSAGHHLTIRDLGSHNGTRVNGELVTSGELVPGDVLTVGATMLLYTVAEPVASPVGDSRLSGVSGHAAALRVAISNTATSEATVLIQGETGVGKEVVATELHRLSGRPGHLVALNCGAVADGVAQSELFGHARGAFSGADSARSGLVASAADGTLFLDEIGDATPPFQAALLRLLETREYRPVGADRTLATTARCVAATHVPLADRVADGTFREDLFSRLERFVINVAPLRSRPEDIMVLALQFARQALGRKDIILRRSLVLALLRYGWPRNVRELVSVMEQLAGSCSDGRTLELTPTVEARLHPRADAEENAVIEEPGHAAASKPDRGALQQQLLDVRCNVRQLARMRGVSRNTLYRWLSEYDIDIQELRNSMER